TVTRVHGQDTNRIGPAGPGVLSISLQRRRLRGGGETGAGAAFSAEFKRSAMAASTVSATTYARRALGRMFEDRFALARAIRADTPWQAGEFCEPAPPRILPVRQHVRGGAGSLHSPACPGVSGS